MARIAWSREALMRIVEIRQYIRQFDPHAAGRLATELLAAGDSLKTFPDRGALYDDGCRILLSVRPYRIIYEVISDTVNILDIRHGAQSPQQRPVS